MRRAIVLLTPALAACLLGADAPPEHSSRLRLFVPPIHHHGTPLPGPPRCIPHTHERAGDPQCVADHDLPTNTPHYFGYYVGGGAPPLHHPECRTPIEGTWGWDYGATFPRRVALGWYHRRHGTDVPRLYRTNNYVPFTQAFDLSER